MTAEALNKEKPMSQCCVSTKHTNSRTLVAFDQLLGWLSKLIVKVGQWLSNSKQHYLNRRTFDQLASLDEATLKDIGLSRGDVTWASNHPNSIEAATELEIISRRRPRSIHQ